MTSDDGIRKKKFKRKLTSFLCQEMLFDYELGRLDVDRKQAVEEFLQTDKECQVILEGIRKGLEYGERLGRTTLKTEVMQSLRESENAVSLGRKYSSWREWPEAFRWSITAIVISTAVAMLVGVIPWSKLPSFRSKKSDSIEIAQLGKSGDKQLEETQEHQEGDVASEEGSGDEEIEAPDAAAIAATKKLAQKPPSESDGDDEESVQITATAASVAALNAKPAAKPTPKPIATKPTAAPIVAVAANSTGAVPTAQGTAPLGQQANPQNTVPNDEADDSSRKEAKARGYVFRAFMTLANLDELGPKITENITELGGDKAGEVELGWKRGTGRYYHFALPEENEEKLLEKLRVYGPVRISKDPHPRVMPTGQIRVILWVESAK